MATDIATLQVKFYAVGDDKIKATIGQIKTDGKAAESATLSLSKAQQQLEKDILKLVAAYNEQRQAAKLAQEMDRAREQAARQATQADVERHKAAIASKKRDDAAYVATWKRLLYERAEVEKRADQEAKAAHKAALEQKKRDDAAYVANYKRLLDERDAKEREIASKSKWWAAALKERERAQADYWVKRIAFEKQQSKKLAEEAAAPYQTLGTRSSAAIEAEKAAVIASFDTIKQSGKESAAYLVKLERDKNAKLRELNKEMVGQHALSMAAMARAVLRIYAAYYVLSQAARLITAPFEKGFKAVEEYKTSVAGAAALVASFSDRGPASMEEHWRRSLNYAKELVPVIEDISAKTLLSGEQANALANAFIRGGVFLDPNKLGQVKAFEQIANALPVLTKGQEIMRQINTEVRALLTGVGGTTSMLLVTLREMDAQIDEHLKKWRAEDTVLEHIGELLSGFAPATKELANTWQAVKSTLDTTVTRILREGMGSAYENIISQVKSLDAALKQNQNRLADMVKSTGEIAENLATAAIWLAKKSTESSGYAMTLIGAAGAMSGGTISISDFLGFDQDQLRSVLDALNKDPAILDLTLKIERLRSALKPFKEKSKYTILSDSEVSTVKELQYELGLLTERYKILYETSSKSGSPTPTTNALKALKPAVDAAMAAADPRADKIAKVNAEYREHITIVEQYIKLSKKANVNNLAEVLSRGSKAIEGLRSEWKKALDSLLDREPIDDATSALNTFKSSLEGQEVELRKGKRAFVEYQLGMKGIEGMALVIAMHQYDVVQGLIAEKISREEAIGSVKSAIKTLADEAAALTQDEEARKQANIQRAYEIAVSEAATDAQKKLANQYLETIKAAQGLAKTKTAVEDFKKSLDGLQGISVSGRSFGDDMADGINNAIVSMNDLLSIMDKVKKQQEDIDATRDKANAIPDIEERSAALSQLSEKEVKLAHDSVYAQIDAYRGLSGAISQAFSEGSDARKAFHDVEMALSAIEIAMELKATAAKLAGYATVGAAAVASAAKQVASAASVAITHAAASVAAQGEIPIAGFALAAAMAAVMGAVLSQAGISFGGGGGGGSAASYKAADYTGTILGSPDKSSESVENITDLLSDIHADEYPELQGIHREMVNLNNNITGLVSSVVRAGGDFSSSSVSGYLTGPANFFDTFAGNASDIINTFIHPEWLFDAIWGENGSLLGKLFDPLGASMGAINDWLGGVLGDVFGGGVSANLNKAGFQLSPMTVGALGRGASIPVQQFQTYNMTESGGWFHDDKNWKETFFQAVDEQTQRLFTQVFKGISDTLVALSDSLGYNKKAIEQYVFDIGQIDLKGLSGEEINERLRAVISTASDQAAEALFKGIAQYQKVGEGLYETAGRLVIDKEVVLSSLDAIGKGFTGLANSLDAVAFSEDLLSYASSLSDFADSVSGYFTDFFSKGDQFRQASKNTRDLLGGMGILREPERPGESRIPTTREALVKLVDALDLTTDAGKRAFVSIMQAEGQLDSYFDAIEQRSKDVASVNRDLKDFFHPLTQYGSLIRSVNDDFQGYIETFQEWGLSVTDLERRQQLALRATTGRYAKGINEDLTGKINQLTLSPEDYQIWQFTNELNDRLSEIAELGPDYSYLADKAKELYKLQIDGIESATGAATNWSNTIKSLSEQILSMRTSTDNPVDIYERIGIQEKAIQDLLGGKTYSEFLSGLKTDEDRQNAIKDIQDLLSGKLSLYQEGYDRPSNQYQSAFDSVLGDLGSLKIYAENLATDYDLQAQQVSLLQQIADNTALFADIPQAADGLYTGSGGYVYTHPKEWIVNEPQMGALVNGNRGSSGDRPVVVNLNLTQHISERSDARQIVREIVQMLPVAIETDGPTRMAIRNVPRAS